MRRVGGEGLNSNDLVGRSPCWIKLVRRGRNVSAYSSIDGDEWDLAGAEQVDLPPVVYVGMVSVCQSGQTPCRATFDHLSISADLPSSEPTPRGVLLRNGSFIAGVVKSADRTSVKLARTDGGDYSVPTPEVARILLRSLSPELGRTLRQGVGGVLFGGGDFSEGEFRAYELGRVSMSSVLFGLQTFEQGQEMVAIVLRESKTKGAIEVRTADGSVLHVESLQLRDGRLLIDDASAGLLKLAEGDVAGIRKRD